MDKRIEKFIKRHHVMTLATVDEKGDAWCCNIFYAYLPDTQELIFTSGENTVHVKHFLDKKEVAASILLESKVVGKLQGVQIKGLVESAATDDYKASFLRAFPYAVFSLKEMWSLKIDYAKYTDNTLGFGTKLIWNREER